MRDILELEDEVKISYYGMYKDGGAKGHLKACIDLMELDDAPQNFETFMRICVMSKNGENGHKL